jgi:hypothetical protein
MDYRSLRDQEHCLAGEYPGSQAAERQDVGRLDPVLRQNRQIVLSLGQIEKQWNI